MWTLAGTFVLVALLWNTPVMWPLRILVVFFHEISHGLAAILTGGSIARITFESNEGGRAWLAGGNGFLAANAGYLGSFLWGSALILASAHTRRDRVVTLLLAAVLGVITILYVRNPFGFVFGLAAAAGLYQAAKRLSDERNDLLLKIIGVTSCGYAILDIWSDVMISSCWSDARILAERTMIPATVWGAFWIGLTLAGTYWTLRLAARAEG